MAIRTAEGGATRALCSRVVHTRMASAPQHEKTASEWRFDSVSDVTIPEAFARDGFVCLSQVLGSGILDEWLEWSYSHFSQCFELLFQQGHTAFPTHRRNGEYAMSCGAKHGFREVVMRSPGRYELSLLQSPTPLLEPILNILSPVIPQLLQESSFDRLQLCHVSLLMATPGATEQAWHADGGHVSLSQHLPCHCLNVFIPLVDIPMNLGPTELRPGTHFHTRNLGPMMLLAKARKTLRSPVVPLLKAGDVLVFDYRVLHRGRANRDPELHRPILVLSFAKTWFVDVCNFPKRSMYEPCSDI